MIETWRLDLRVFEPMNPINTHPGAALNGHAPHPAPAPIGGAAFGFTPDPGSAPKLHNLAALLPTYESDAETAHAARLSGKPRGPLSGFPTLDQNLGGCFPPGLSFCHGYPGAGKTAFGLQVAAQCQCPALVVTCEMSPVELFRRHTARVTKTYLGRLKSGEIPPAASLALAQQAIEAAPGLHFVDATQAPASAPYLLDCAKIVKGDAPHLLIVIDSLHAWAESFQTGAAEYDTLNSAISALRGLSHHLGCTVLAICERNRATMDGGGLSSGAGTRKIEYGAEVIFDLRRDLNAKPNGGGEVEIEVRLAKNRHGSPGDGARLLFNGALQCFREG
jgi:replicative DNA helicase